MSHTLVENISGSPISLPSPFVGVLPAGQSKILADYSPSQVIVLFGGIRSVLGVVQCSLYEEALPTGEATAKAETEVLTGALIPRTLSNITQTWYVRPTGSDANGDGSLSNPYRTLLPVAQRELPLEAVGANYVIDCTGLNDTGVYVEIFNRRLINGTITLQAAPTILATMLSGTVSLGTPNSRTFKVVVTVSPSPGWTVNQWQAKLLTEIGGSVDGAQIVSNTANTLTVVGAFFTGGLNLQIEDCGAILQARSFAAGGGPALYLKNIQASFTVKKIKFTTLSDSALKIENSAGVVIQSCESQGIDTVLNPGSFDVNNCHFTADVNWDFSGNSIWFGNFYQVLNPAPFVTNQQGGTLRQFYEYSLSCGSFPRYDSSLGTNPNSFGYWEATGCEFDLSYRRAVFCYGKGLARVKDCLVTNCVTGGIQALQDVWMQVTNTIGNITNTAASSVGLLAGLGATMKVDSTSLITVAGSAVEVKVGSLAGTTKAAFNLLPVDTGQIDLTSNIVTGVVTGTASHMHQ